MTYEFDEGMLAAANGADRSENPYDSDSQEYAQWNDGFDFFTGGGV